MSSKKIIIIIVSLVAIIGFPVAVGKGVSAEIFMDWTNTNDWIGFWASYSAALLGIAVPITVFYLQRNEDRKQFVLPAVNAYQLNGNSGNPQKFDFTIDYLWHGDELKGWVLDDVQHEAAKTEVTDKTRWFQTKLIVKNIGSGPVMDLSIDVIGKNEKKSEYAICLAEKELALYNIYISSENLKQDGNKLIFHFTNIYKKRYSQSIEFGMRNNNGEWVLTDFGRISKLNEE